MGNVFEAAVAATAASTSIWSKTFRSQSGSVLVAMRARLYGERKASDMKMCLYVAARSYSNTRTAVAGSASFASSSVAANDARILMERFLNSNGVGFAKSSMTGAGVS